MNSINSEEEFTKWLRMKTGPENSEIGDDCAVLTGYNPNLLLTQDSLVSSIHYDSKYSARQIGNKLAAINLSDIAAMGGQPRQALCSISSSADSAKIEGILEGCIDKLDSHEISLSGGDTTANTDGEVLTLFLLGETISEGYLSRSKARPGDKIAITGYLGGVRALLESSSSLNSGPPEIFYDPRDRIDLGMELVRGGLRCGMDLSDGFMKDLRRLCKSSDVGAELNWKMLPLDERTRSHSSSKIQALRWALEGGEEFELIVAIPPELNLEASEFDLTVVGKFTEANDVEWSPPLPAELDNIELKNFGYDHFQDYE